MVRSISSSLRDALLALACVAAVGSLQAQTAPEQAAAPGAATKQDENLEGRRNQKIERIHIDDGGATVDELRYGGQTKNITVTPKGRMPPYEVKPGTDGRATQGQGEPSGGGTGPAVWNVLKF